MSSVAPPSLDADDPRPKGFASQGLSLNYVDWGHAGAPLLILVHGGFDHSRSFDDLARALRPDFHVLAVDLRGHGDSDWSAEGNYTLNAQAEDLAELLRHLPVSRATLIGHSYGGRVVLRFAGLYPERVDRLIVLEGLDPNRRKAKAARSLDVATRHRNYRASLRDLRGRAERGFASLSEAADRMRARNARLKPELALHLARHGTRQGEDGRLRWKFDRCVGPVAPVDITPRDERWLFSRISAPTLLIHGDESGLARPDQDDRVALMPSVETIEISGAGHWMHHDRPSETRAAIVDFLLRAVSTGASGSRPEPLSDIQTEESALCAKP